MKKGMLMVLAVLLAVFLAGCKKEIGSIRDFAEFADLQRETDRIEVTFDNHTGVPFFFAVEEPEEIEEVMEILFSASFKKMGTEINAGDNTSVKIIQGEKVYSVHCLMNKEGRYFYSFSTGEFQEKIIELAKEAGDYEGVW